MVLDAVSISERVEARRRVVLDHALSRRLGRTDNPGGAYLTPDATVALLCSGVTAFFASLWYRDTVVTSAAILADGVRRISLHIASSSTGKKPALFQEASALTNAAEELGFSVVGVYAYLPRRDYERLGEVDPDLLFHRVDIHKNARRTEPRAPRRSAARDGLTWYVNRGERGCLDRDAIETLVARNKLPTDIDTDRISKVPTEVLVGRKQRVQAAAVRENAIVLDEAEVVRCLNLAAGDKRSYLDFETTASPVPEWEGAKPWQHVPMMFSLLEVEGSPSSPRLTNETVFVPDGASDPREQLAGTLVDRLRSDDGPVIVFDDGLERRVLFSLAARLPRLAPAIEEIAGRLVDLSMPFRGFFVYHPDQCGKTSLKVLLRIYGTDEYESLLVSDGRLAHDLLAAVSGNLLTKDEHAEALERLSTYVLQDTHSLVTLHKATARLLAQQDAWVPPP